MARYRKTTPEEEAASEQRIRDFEEVLKRRLEVSARLREEREAREQSEQQR